MGWLFTERSDTETDKEFFAREFGSAEILDLAKYGSTIYMKVKHHGKTFAVVCLTKWANADRCNFGYKDVDESMGPYEVKGCPLRILDGLDEPVNEYAKRWRADVVAWHAKKKPKPKEGDIIRLAAPIAFTDGFKGDRFTVTHYLRRGKRRTAYLGENGRMYRITNLAEREFEVIGKVGVLV